MAQLGSALDWGSRGRGFKSRRSDFVFHSIVFTRQRCGESLVWLGRHRVDQHPCDRKLSERASVTIRCAATAPEHYHERYSLEANRHAENLLPLITELLLASNLAQRDLDAITVGVGPGSFTGLRAGIALGVGLGLGLDVPVFGVSSLTALACALSSFDTTSGRKGDQPELIGALLDARRGEYFFAAFTPDLEQVVAPCILPGTTLANDIAALTQHRSLWVAGQAALQNLDASLLAPRTFYERPEVLFPSARAGATLTGSVHATLDPLPQYLREPDVKVPQLPPNPLVGVD